MNQSSLTLADEIVRVIQLNRTTINGLQFGEVVFRTHQGRLIEVMAAETLKLSVGARLCPLRLRREESEQTSLESKPRKIQENHSPV